MSTTTVTFTNPDLVARAQRKAHTLGLSLSTYVSHLVDADTKNQPTPPAHFPAGDSWGPVPAHVAKRWDEEERQFEEEMKSGSNRPGVKGATSVQELMDELDQETHLLDNAKDN